MLLTRLIYASKHEPLAAGELDRLLDRSRINNLRDKITGALVVDDHWFMQVLEGERSAVAGTFMRIMQDNRHTEVQVICAADVNMRMFADWSMHHIQASRIKAEIVERHTVNGAFEPSALSARSCTELCRALADTDWGSVIA